MELCDVDLTTGRVVRICDEADDLAALREAMEREARDAQALAVLVMGGEWLKDTSGRLSFSVR